METSCRCAQAASPAEKSRLGVSADTHFRAGSLRRCHSPPAGDPPEAHHPGRSVHSHCAASRKLISEYFRYPEKKPHQPLRTPDPALGKQESTFCLYGFATAGHFVSTESYDTQSLVTGSFPGHHALKAEPCCNIRISFVFIARQHPIV